MTQKQAAEQLGVSLPTVGRWEIGEFEPRGLARKLKGDSQGAVDAATEVDFVARSGQAR